MKKVFTFLSFSMILSHVFSQLNTASLERFNQKWVEEIPDYVDSYPDSLFYGNRILFFRQTPLILKPGHSGIYLADKDPEMLNGIFNFYGLRGYRLSWMVRNDSLFIHRINMVTPWWIDPVVLSGGRDIIHSRMEKFTGRRFINGLLFVDWITGDLPVISKYCGYDGPILFNNGKRFYHDDRNYGSILMAKNGLVVDFREDQKNNPPCQTNIAQREWDYEMIKRNWPFYVDAEPDSVLYGGRKYFFRQSPLSLKRGYTDVYHEDEVSIFNVSSNGSTPGMKGYHLSWVTRNDSLFISDIYPTYYDPKRPTLSKDTIISRMEAFTGRRFINGLMFVDWISGSFGVMSTHIRNFREIIDEKKTNEKKEREYKDDRKYGSIMLIQNGLVTKFFEEDHNKVKN